MESSLALVPVHAFPPFFSRAGGLLENYNHNPGRSDPKVEPIINESDGLNRFYGSAGYEIVRAVKGTLVDTYI